eukprot:9771849-Alexandrium_andersonii.AAC.1
MRDALRRAAPMPPKGKTNGAQLDPGPENSRNARAPGRGRREQDTRVRASHANRTEHRSKTLKGACNCLLYTSDAADDM